MFKSSMSLKLAPVWMIFYISATGVWGGDTTEFRTAQEKEQLWRDLKIEYATKNIVHEFLGSMNLVLYFKKNRNKQISLDKTSQTIDKKTLKNSKYLNQLKNAFECEDFIIETDEPRNFNDGIFIKQSPRIGWSAFASKAFRSGEIIGEYTGEIKYFSNSEEDSIEYYGSLSSKNLDFEAEIIPAVFLQSESSYIMRYNDKHPYFTAEVNKKVTPRLVIDSRLYRNEISFINNSRFPNVSMRKVIKIVRSHEDKSKIREIKVAIVAKAERAISEGEELLANYGYNDDDYKDKKFIDYRGNNLCYKCSRIIGENNCSKCKIARYCSRSCQLADWQAHKIFCHAPQ